MSPKPGTQNDLYLGSLSFYFLGGLAVLWVILLIRRILGTTVRGEPFDEANVRSLNTIGWILVAAGAVGPFLEFLLVRWILARVGPTAIAVTPPLDFRFGVVLQGLFVLVLAVVWREAVGMAEEQSLTV